MDSRVELPLADTHVHPVKARAKTWRYSWILFKGTTTLQRGEGRGAQSYNHALELIEAEVGGQGFDAIIVQISRD